METRTLFIPVIENRTGEIGLEVIMTRELVHELMRGSAFSQGRIDQADFTLRGGIDTLSEETISRIKGGTGRERRVRAKLHFSLRTRDGEIFWSNSGVGLEETYVVIPLDRAATEANRNRALEVLSQRLAERMRRRIVAYMATR